MIECGFDSFEIQPTYSETGQRKEQPFSLFKAEGQIDPGIKRCQGGFAFCSHGLASQHFSEQAQAFVLGLFAVRLAQRAIGFEFSA